MRAPAKVSDVHEVMLCFYFFEACPYFEYRIFFICYAINKYRFLIETSTSLALVQRIKKILMINILSCDTKVAAGEYVYKS